MNKKLIAAAVSAAVMAPVAHAEITVYGNITNSIHIVSPDGDKDNSTNIDTLGSRFGVKYSADLGNGLTANGKYEVKMNTGDGGDSFGDVRVATAGLSGGFGRVDVGNQWSAYYDTFGTLVSPTYSLGYYLYSSVGGGPFRTSNTIKYSNTFGPLYAELDVRLDDGGSEHDDAEKIHGDGIGLGLSFSVTDNITIAAAFDSEDGTAGSDAVKGLTARASKSRIGTAPRAAFTVTAAEVIAGRVATANDVRDAIAAGDIIYGVDGQPVYTAVAADVQTEIELGDVLVEADDSVTEIEASDDYEAEDLGQLATDGTPAGSDLPDTDRVGVGVKYNFGAVAVTLGWQNYSVDDNENTAVDDEVDIDTLFINASGSLGEKTSWYLGYSEGNDGTDAIADDMDTVNTDESVVATDDSTQLTWGIYHNLGGGMKLYYEATSVENDAVKDVDDIDGTRHLLGMRIDF